MGKTRRLKPSRAANPLGIMGDLNQVDELLNASGSSGGPVENIVEQLQSAIVEEKMCGLQALAFLCQNKDKVDEIIRSDLIRIAAPLLKDNNKSIRHATSGALRNLSVWGDEVCRTLVDRDCLTPLLALLNEYALNVEWVPTFDDAINNALDEPSDTFLQAVNLVWNLCESSEIALKFFNQSQILESFIRCMKHEVFGYDISIAVAQCVLVISEDNPSSWRVLNECKSQLALLCMDKGNDETLLTMLVAAIVSNVPNLLVEMVGPVMNTALMTLSINHRNILNNFTSAIEFNTSQRDRLEIEVTDENSMQDGPEESAVAAHKRRRLQDQPTKEDQVALGICRLLEAQRLAAEVVTNLSSTDDEAWEDNGSDNSSDDEIVHDYDVRESHGYNLKDVQIMNGEIKQCILIMGFVEKLWQKSQPIAENVAQMLTERNKDISEKLTKLRVSSLLCLQNLCISLTTDELGGVKSLYSVWLDLGQQVFQFTHDIALLEASTALMRASLQHLRNNPELFQQMSNSDLDLMLGGVRDCSEPEVRANWLRMLGILGCILKDVLVKKIVDFILETCAQETECWTISEGVDSLMDMFADNDREEVVHEVHMVERIKVIEKSLKNKMRQQKRELGERLPAVDAVKCNLSRFVRYVESHQVAYLRNLN